MKIKNLKCIHMKEKVTDFYGVNKIIFKNGDTAILTDCNNPIVEIKNGIPHLLIRHPSNWEIIAIKEFLEQNGFNVKDTKISFIRRKYG